MCVDNAVLVSVVLGMLMICSQWGDRCGQQAPIVPANASAPYGNPKASFGICRRCCRNGSCFIRRRTWTAAATLGCAYPCGWATASGT